MSFNAVGKFIVVKVVEEKVSRGGIVLPDNTEAERPMRGTVVSAGDEVNPNVEEGDFVLFDGAYAYDMGDGKVAIEERVVIAYETDERSPEREDVYDDIDRERDHQDRKWGGFSNDDVKTEEEWVNHIGEYSQGRGRAARLDFRTRMVKTAALSVASIESIDRQAASLAFRGGFFDAAATAENK